MRACLSEACRIAHAEGVRAEQLIVILKAAWASSTDARTPLNNTGGTELLRGLVSVMVESYYSR